MRTLTGKDRHRDDGAFLRSGFARHGWVLILFAALVVAATWPVIARLDTAIIGRESDAYVHLWLFHWIEDMVREGRVSFYTDRLFYPNGVSLLNQTVAWLNAALWLLVKPLVGALPAYSLLVMALIVFNGFSVFLLARDLTDSWSASVVAGTVTLLWPAVYDHTHQVSLLPIGFVVMALRALHRLFDRGRTSDMVEFGIWLGLIGILRFQMLILGAFVWGLYAAIRLFNRDLRTIWHRVRLVLGSGVLGAVLSLPFTLPYLLFHFQARETGELVASISGSHFSDLVFYLLPRSRHLLFGGLSEELALDYGLELSLNSPAIGWITLILVVVSWALDFQRSGRWTVIAGVLLVLALGAHPHLFGMVVRFDPYARMYSKLLLPLLREPGRFNLLLSIPMGLLAGFGFEQIHSRLRTPSLRGMAVFSVIALVFVDSVALPHRYLGVEVPAWYQTLADDEEEYALLEVPMYRQFDERYMLYQLTHDKPLVHGHVSRVPGRAYDFIDTVPLLRHLQYVSHSVPPAGDFNLAESLDMLDEAEVRYVIIHRRDMSEDDFAAWQEWFPYAPDYEESGLLVFRTDWREAWYDSRGSADLDVELVRLNAAPDSTVPGGWVDMTALWYLPADVPRGLTLELRDEQGVTVGEWPEVALLGAISRREGVDTLVLREYGIQIPPDVEPGVYQFCFTGKSGNAGVGRRDPRLCYEYRVEARDRAFTSPDYESPVGVLFGDVVELVGITYDLNENVLRLKPVWRAARAMETSYKVFVHVMDEESGLIAAQKDFVPRNWTYPTTFWRAGEYVEDEVLLDVSGLAPGAYEVYLGLYPAEGGVRLSTSPAHPNGAVPLLSFERE